MKTLLYCALGAILTTSVAVEAQNARPPREDRREQRQQGNENLTPEQQQVNRSARWQERMKSMTPEQRQRMQERMAEFQQKMTDAGIDPNDPNAWQKARDSGIMGNRGGGQNGGGGRGGNRGAADAMRQMMEAAGISNFDVQDAIIAYVAEQNQARATLFQLAQTAATALQTPAVVNVNTGEEPNVEAADARVATTFGAYEAAVKAENERQEKALQVLDAKINYSGTPRIKAFLTLVGILNNDVLAIGGPAAVFAPSQDLMQTGMDGEMQGGGAMQTAGRGGRGGRGGDMAAENNDPNGP